MKNEIVYTTLNSKYIFKCKCLNDLNFCSYTNKLVHYSDFATYECDKTIIIEIYDNNKNIIINPITITISNYKYILKKDFIISLKICAYVQYYITFLRAYICVNKIYNTKYYIDNNGCVNAFSNNNIYFECYGDFLKLKNLDYSAKFFLKGNYINTLSYNYDKLIIEYYSYKIYNYHIIIYDKDDEIYITRYLKEDNKKEYTQCIRCNKKLQILQFLERDVFKNYYIENRNNNGEITSIIKYDNNTKKEETVLSNDKNISFLIKFNEDCYQDLIKIYNLSIEYNIDKLIYLKNKELFKARINLLNEIDKYSS